MTSGSDTVRPGLHDTGPEDEAPSGRGIEAAFLAACRAELAAIKPGNVHVHAAGHRMDAQTFEKAALAASPIVADAGLGVGERVLAATRASVAAAGCNANLGILLLAGPLARAFERAGPSPGEVALRRALETVLADLDAEDARSIFAAIAHASPGGLGEAGEEDVRRAPQIGVVEAMGLAAGRDLIARQYVNGYADLFDTGLKAAARAPTALREHPALGLAFAIYIAFAARFPDSHVSRKFGLQRAEDVHRRFKNFAQVCESCRNGEEIAAKALILDRELKSEGINPGTCADLTVATLFILYFQRPGFFPAPLRASPPDD
ncbi:triphosphoribosyl-dephospho-CoA synthase [Fulvimarina endophytica]|uniref:Triphosphoribosyl-dephospho-CoA synthase n=1 Tax=Fulvimarina endophytica TaxID=2293836 RepID=A0A371X1B3_9HYPH|nr:triphosphoribosyl-dephospho-CoA synthase [Fulvimarina endophytica]RFC63023.1 triphosphoribosyl-dephospho-CoA synthase [Fulvimarina endophytica]